MFGNLFGWMIAVIIGGLLLLGGYELERFNTISHTTDWGSNPKQLAEMKLGVSPDQIVPMTATGDSADMYREAISDYLEQPESYELAIKSNDLTSLKALKGVQKLLAATPIAKMSLYTDNPDRYINYDYKIDQHEALMKVAECAKLCGLLLDPKKPDEAKKYFEATFSLGAKMFNERIRFKQAFDGMGLMGNSCTMLSIEADKKKDAARVALIEKFEDERKTLYKERMEPMWNVINSVDSTKIYAHAGDVFYFSTTEQKDRMWRVESILKLGRMKYNIERKADQVGVPNRLRQLNKDQDKVIQTAAQTAEKLTLDQYRSLRFME